MERGRLVRTGLLILGCSGAGFLGAEIHARLNPPIISDIQFAEIDLDSRRVLLDIGDRYQLTNDRLNRYYLNTTSTLKTHDRKIQEIVDYVGIDRPTPTPKPRPTVSDRLRPQPTSTPRS